MLHLKRWPWCRSSSSATATCWASLSSLRVSSTAWSPTPVPRVLKQQVQQHSNTLHHCLMHCSCTCGSSVCVCLYALLWVWVWVPAHFHHVLFIACACTAAACQSNQLSCNLNSLHRNTPDPPSPAHADIANAVLDGVDGILLGAETLRGEYPVDAVATIAQICRYALLHSTCLACGGLVCVCVCSMQQQLPCCPSTHPPPSSPSLRLCHTHTQTHTHIISCCCCSCCCVELLRVCLTTTAITITS
jgi:Pyruvate kinase, barrel domain